jgi:RNA polymerase sigma-70 factor (ECF subfamily)
VDQRRAIELARLGREDGFQWLFQRHRLAIHRYVRRFSGIDEDAAKDVAQNTFIRAFNGLGGLKDDDSYEAWLHRIARREALRYLGRQAKNGGEPLDHELDVACERHARVEEEREHEQLLAQVRHLASTIEPRQIRDTATRYYLGVPCTTEAVAKELGVPHATVRKRLFAFRDKLRTLLLAEVAREG